MRNVESMLHMIKTYAGASDYLAIFIICTIFLFYRADKIRRREIILVSLLSFVLVFNNLAWRFVGKVMESLTYYRFLWMVPIVLVIAYTITYVIDELKGKIETAFVVLLCAAMVMLAGESYMHKDALAFPETIYDLSEDVIQTCEIISEDKENEYPVVAFEPGLNRGTRVYDPTILWAISKREYDNMYAQGFYEKTDRYKTAQVLVEAVNMGNQENAPKLKKAIEKKKVDYLVISTSFGMDAYLAEAGCYVVGHTNSYTVYAYGVRE